jgi:hypothetical protein
MEAPLGTAVAARQIRAGSHAPCGMEWGVERGAGTARDGSRCGMAALEKATASNLTLEKGVVLSFFLRSETMSGAG